MVRDDGFAGWYLSFAVENLSTETDRLDGATMKLADSPPIAVPFTIEMPAPMDQYHVLITNAQMPTQLIKYGDTVTGEVAFEFRRAGLKRHPFVMRAARPR
jgi:hypothetical protein